MILVTLGFHTEEVEFGRDVLRYFNEHYSSEGVKLTEIENSVPARENQEPAKIELSDLIKKYEPVVLIDIHHSRGFTDESRAIFYEMAYPKPIVQNRNWLLRLLFGKPEVFQMKPCDIAKEFLEPIWADLRNPSVNQGLLGYLVQQQDLGRIGTEEQDKYMDKYRVASELGTAFISVEAILYGNGNSIRKDEVYNQAMRNTAELVHRVRNYIINEN